MSARSKIAELQKELSATLVRLNELNYELAQSKRIIDHLRLELEKIKSGKVYNLENGGVD